MANIKDTKKEALAIINGALTILERFPEFDETNTTLSYDTSTNPFPFLIDLFKSTSGYNVLIKILSSFIALGMPALELAAKGVLLSNLKNILSCSLNPFISNEILKDGIVFDLRTLDLMNMLRFSPFDKIGRYYYFGCDGMEYTDLLVNAADFNAFLWYVKNKSPRRQVWYGVDMVAANSDSLFNTDDDFNSTMYQKGPKENQTPPKRGETKCKKSDGIITLQYCERPSSLRNAEGDGMSYMQIPHNNCLQVFIGNVQDTHDEVKNHEMTIANADKAIAEQELILDNLHYNMNNIAKERELLGEKVRNQEIDWQQYENEYDFLLREQNEINNDIVRTEENINGLVSDKTQAIANLKTAIAELNNTAYFRTIEQNYYYGHTLIEFNTDYIMSLKLFDSKVVIAQLIDALTGCLSIDVHLSYEQLLVKYETQRMVKAIIETDDTVVSDCFFSFSNKEYDKMLQKAELAREDLYAMNVDNPTGVKIDSESILNSINTISDGSSKETVQSVIEGSLTELSKMLSSTEYEDTEKVNFGAEINFIENVMNNLAYIITSAVLSPKLYLLLAINLKLIGQQTNFNINDFIDKYRQMIVQLIRTFRDQMLNYIVNELMKILSDLSSEIAVKLAVEQAQYYRRLIKRLIDCFKRERGSNLGFNIDNVDYADILKDEETEPIKDEC